jgi:hypothetical protein
MVPERLRLQKYRRFGALKKQFRFEDGVTLSEAAQALTLPATAQVLLLFSKGESIEQIAQELRITAQPSGVIWAQGIKRPARKKPNNVTWSGHQNPIFQGSSNG